MGVTRIMEIRNIVKTVMHESIQSNEDYSDTEAMIDDVYRCLCSLADSVKNRLYSKFRYPEDEALAIKKLEQIQSFIEQEADVFLEKVESELGD